MEKKWLFLKLNEFDEEKERDFSRKFWSQCSAEDKMNAVQDLVETAWLMKGKNLQDLSMRRDVFLMKKMK